jgi:hypothetical protein
LKRIELRKKEGREKERNGGRRYEEVRGTDEKRRRKMAMRGEEGRKRIRRTGSVRGKEEAGGKEKEKEKDGEGTFGA